MAWHRVPFTLGCAGEWTEEARAEHYDNLCQIDGRIVLAGEHASDIPAWQEGAILSSLDAITRLHDRVVRIMMQAAPASVSSLARTTGLAALLALLSQATATFAQDNPSLRRPSARASDSSR